MEGPFSFKRKAGVEYHPVLEEEEEVEEETPYHLLVLPGGVGGRFSVPNSSSQTLKMRFLILTIFVLI